MTVTQLPAAHLRHLRPTNADRLSRAATALRVVTAHLTESHLIAAAVATVCAVHLFNIAGWPSFFDDEGTYASQAWAVRNGSLAPYTYWYDHPPLGWVQLAVVQWLPELLLGDAPYLVAGRVAMVAFTAATAGLLYMLGRRIGLRPVTAATGVLLWGLSPLVVFEGRQVLLDNIALPWLVGSFVLATSRSRNLWHHTAAGLAFGGAVLTKETVLVVLPAVLVALWHSAYRPTRAFSMTGFLMATAFVGSAYLLFAALRNELLPGPSHVSLWDALAFQFGGREGSGFILDEGSGAHGTLGIWLHYDHVVIGLGLLSSLVCLAVGRLRSVGLAVALLTAVALRPDGYLPFMYVVAVLPFLALAIAAVGDGIWSWLRRLDGSRGSRSFAALGAAAGTAGVLWLAPVWVAGNQEAVRADVNGSHRLAMTYLSQNLPRDTRVVVDNTYWNDLVRAGWSADGFDGAIWFYKIDLDAEAETALPGGWTDVDYLLWSKTLESDPNALPSIREAYEHSSVVAEWGSAEDLVQLRRVEGGAP
jgi:hypothetical protein